MNYFKKKQIEELENLIQGAKFKKDDFQILEHAAQVD